MTNDDTKMPEPMSKEEMIDTLKGLVFGTFDRTTAKEREALDMAIKSLEQTRWIPVSERLPNAQKDGDKNFSDWVMVSIRVNDYQRIVCSAYYCFSDKKWYLERMGCGEVMAWKSLPQPYKECDKE